MQPDSDWERHLDRAEYAIFREKWRAAERIARRMISRYPDRVEGYVFAAGLLRRRGRDDDALGIVEDAFRAVGARKCAALALLGATVAAERGDETATRRYARIAAGDPFVAEALAGMPGLAQYWADQAYRYIGQVRRARPPFPGARFHAVLDPS